MEYYVVEKKNNLGEQYIELSVFQSITTHEMSKIEVLILMAEKVLLMLKLMIIIKLLLI